MRLNPEILLSNLIKIKEKICAPDIIWTPYRDNIPKNIVIDKITTNLTAAPGKLIVLHSIKNAADIMEQCLLYIPLPDKKFHFVECKTVNDMRQKGRGERYVLTNKTTGLFEIYRDRYKVQEKLFVCKNCLWEWNYKGYRSLSSHQQDIIVQNFDIKNFFANCRPLLQSVPLRTGKTLLNQNAYDQNWKYLTRAYRASKGWCCEECGVDLSDHREFLHTHHVNGIKYDVRFGNLKALCILCHSKQPNHQHLKNLPEFAVAKSFILRKREGMGL